MMQFFRNIYREVINSQYFKNMFLLTSGVGVSQLIPFLLLPILTRFFSPVDFGFFALFMAIIQLLSTSMTFRLEMAVVLPKKNTDAALLCIISLICLMMLSLVSFCVLFLGQQYFLNLLSEGGYFNQSYLINPLILYLLPLGVFLLGFYNILYSWNNRLELYKKMSYSHIIHSIFSTPSSILLYFSALQPVGLILGQLIGRLFASFLLLKDLIYHIRLIPSHNIINNSKSLLIEYRKFIIFETPHAILNFISHKIILGVFAALFGLFTVGIFDLADKIIGKPLGVISNSFKTVFYQRLTTAKDKLAIFKKSVFLMLVISTCLIIPFYILPENFFVIVLGPEWADIGIYIKLLCPLLFARFVFNVVMPSLSYTLQNHYLLIWQLIYLILLLFMFWYIPSLNVEDMLFIYSLLGAVMYSLLGFMSYLVLKNKCQT